MAIEVKENVPIGPYTVYKIGGPARFFVEVKSVAETEEALRYAAERGIPFFILGAGSNMIVSDKGCDGIVIRMTGGDVRAQGERLIADAGVMMARAVSESAKTGLTGFEWGIGVPGTVGGSVRGNAGCFGSEMKDIVESVLVFDTLYPKRYTLNARECAFGYRDSIFKRRPEWIILSVTLKLAKGNPAAIQERIRQITQERVTKQDIGTKSCGCIFKNVSWTRKDIDKKKLLEAFPELEQYQDRANIPASYLLDASGCKSIRVSSVVISPKHANFFVNEGGASAGDVKALIAKAKEKEIGRAHV